MSYLSRFKPKFDAGHLRYLNDDSGKLINYLKCDGSVVSQTTYPKLFPKVGRIFDWATATTETTTNVTGLKRANQFFFYFGDNGLLKTSTNGTSWTLRTTGTTESIKDITYGTEYVYGGTAGAIATSTNASTWTIRTSGTTSNIISLTYGSIYVYGTIGGGLSTSTNGITWTARTSGTTSDINALTYGNALYVFGTQNGGLSTSTNGTTWTARTSGTTTHIRSLLYANSLYVYAGNDGVLATSTDAITWSARNSATTDQINSLTYDSTLSLYFYVTKNGYIGTSTDAISWVSNKRYPVNSTVDSLQLLNVASGSSKTLFIDGGTNQKVYSLDSTTVAYNVSTEFLLPTTNTQFQIKNVTQTLNAYIKAV